MVQRKRQSYVWTDNDVKLFLNIKLECKVSSDASLGNVEHVWIHLSRHVLPEWKKLVLLCASLVYMCIVCTVALGDELT